MVVGIFCCVRLRQDHPRAPALHPGDAQEQPALRPGPDRRAAQRRHAALSPRRPGHGDPGALPGAALRRLLAGGNPGKIQIRHDHHRRRQRRRPRGAAGPAAPLCRRAEPAGQDVPTTSSSSATSRPAT